MLGAKGIPVEAGLSGGIERVVEELSRRLVERGHQVTVYVRPYQNAKKRKRWEGVRIVTLPCLNIRYLETATHVFLSTIHVLFQKVDVIHFHGVGPSMFAWIPRVFKPRAKVVVTFHVRDQFHELRHPLIRLVLSYGEWTAVRFPHATIAVSRVIQDFCRLRFEKDVTLIPNAVSLPNLNVGSDRLASFGVKPRNYLLGFGRLVQFKAFDVAIDAYREVKTNMPFVVAGAPGYDKKYASRLLQSAGQDERIRLVGFQTGDDLKQLIANAYAVVHPSRIEGMSLAVLEAMSFGKLVIMSDVPENREIADHSAVVVTVDSDAAFRDAMNWAVTDPAMVKERGSRARVFVAENYSWGPVVQATEQLYKRLTRG